MLYWLLKKGTKEFKLCGTYDNLRYGDRKGDEASFVTFGECDYELPKETVESFFSNLEFNPFSDYKFIVNKEKFEKFSIIEYFPSGLWFMDAFLIDEDNKIASPYFYPRSNSRDIRLLESLFNCIGYSTTFGRFGWREAERYVEEDGYKLVFWYGAAKNNAFFAKKI
jgi:hypothetical protein